MPLQNGTTYSQPISSIQYEVRCGNCKAHARWSPFKLPTNIAKTARCDDCLKAEAMAEGRAKAQRVKKNKAAQAKMPWHKDYKGKEETQG